MLDLVEYRPTEKILADLIQEGLGVPPGIVAIYNSQRRIPPKLGFFVDVAILGFAPFAVATRPTNDPSEPEVVAVQTIAQREIYQIDIFSADDSARLRKIDMLFALTSVAAQQQSERHSFRIANIPASFVDASEIEASRRLNRFALTVTVLRSYSKAETVPTFSQFQIPPREIIVNP